jgi:hypothetical protein
VPVGEMLKTIDPSLDTRDRAGFTAGGIDDKHAVNVEALPCPNVAFLNQVL